MRGSTERVGDKDVNNKGYYQANSGNHILMGYALWLGRVKKLWQVWVLN